MTRPSFIGIGAQRAGSTWLHELLSAHTGVYMPTRRKEVHYFDRYLSRGSGWYEAFFSGATPQQIAGEVTPDYLHTPGCAAAIADLLPDAKLVVILRNPVERAYSHYQKLVKDDNYHGSFGDAVRAYPDLVERGFYAAQLGDYLRHFSKQQLCVLIYEDAVTHVEGTKEVLAAFFGLEVTGFSAASGEKVVHQSYVPRARAAYALAKSLARKLHAADLDGFVNLAKRLNLAGLFGRAAAQSGAQQRMTQETRRALSETYETDIRTLEQLFDLDLGVWRNP